jgi:hypothetical protein
MPLAQNAAGFTVSRPLSTATCTRTFGVDLVRDGLNQVV